ncbi:MAG: hypothetical protein EOO11_06310 [Chitinophagaceae bacterium]|nr:MAG: hypothetical protein EOO11_06310 [Chitinophagaceae bacterium]
MKTAGTFFLKRDDVRLGLAVGLIAPILIFFLIYALRFTGYDFGEFLDLFVRERRLITFFGAWCLVGNIALFTAYINSNRDRTARGIFIVTLVYGVAVLLAKALI